MTPPNPLVDYFRCADALSAPITPGELSSKPGYFAVRDAICFGRLAGRIPASDVNARLLDASEAIDLELSSPALPFDLGEVVSNLRQEQYHQNGYNFLDKLTSARAAERLYYLLRPMLRVGVRKHLQRIRLGGWERLAFPRWPVDVSVDSLMRSSLRMAMKSAGTSRVPFVWFWPNGASSAVMMTHDVEGPAGRAFCDRVMDVDDSYNIKSAFQLVPQGQEDGWMTLARRLRQRGFEVNLHDLNHDGHLFDNQPLFLERAKEINRYAREFECRGFRSGAMYREQQWFEAFEFSYDMSVPNVAHLEPQRGGCCTVMPYFVGNIVELPLTTIQDYSLFHILGDYSIALWKQQVEAIRAQHGLMTFLTHPDYLTDPRALAVYIELLAYLRDLRHAERLWVALPGDIDRWWRQRQQMTVARHGTSWRIDGPDARRASLAYASLDGDQVRYEIADAG